jgi:ribosomal protein S18 acetylase RimI-like enzyme
VVGTLQLTLLHHLSHRGATRAHIESVRVASHLRGRGVGHELVEWALARAGERGARLAQLSTDKTRADAHRFYESLGFRATHEGMKLSLVEDPARNQ